MKILVVDDSLMDRKIIINTLKKAEIENETLEATNGEEGLKVLSDNYKDIGLILLDWQMPVMNGLEFMDGVSKVPEVSSIPIVMVTASSSEDSKKQAYDANPNLAGYITKPIAPKKFVETVQSIIS